MEFSLYSLLPFATFLILFSLSFVLIFKPKSKISGLPPGKTGYPFIGESYDFLSNGWKGQPEKFITERMAKFSPQAFTTSLFGAPTIVMCSAPGNKFLFSNENRLVTAWWPSSIDKVFPSSTQTSSNDEMRKMRKLLPQFLRAEALHKYIGNIINILYFTLLDLIMYSSTYVTMGILGILIHYSRAILLYIYATSSLYFIVRSFNPD